jgi:IS5 family transposase
VLQALYNLSDDQAEYQLRDRFSFMRFLGLELEDAVPDAKTLWLYREALATAGAVEELFDLFDGFLKNKGYLAMKQYGVELAPPPDLSLPYTKRAGARLGGSRRLWMVSFHKHGFQGYEA